MKLGRLLSGPPPTPGGGCALVVLAALSGWGGLELAVILL